MNATRATLGDWTCWGVERLAGAGIEDTRLESQLLLAWAAGISRLEILARPEQMLDSEAGDRFQMGIDQRRRRIPLAYIRRFQEFYGLEFTVTPEVLIPRPETELLVDLAREIAAEQPAPTIWDVGTGSGCIAVSCGVRIPEARVAASDISAGALAVARSNAARHHVEDRVGFVRADLLSAVKPGSASIILANPPYIGREEIASLQPEVRDHEPRLALGAGEDGLTIFRRLVPQAFRALTPNGWFATEVALGQAQNVLEMFHSAGFHHVNARRDLAGVERAIIGQRP